MNGGTRVDQAPDDQPRDALVRGALEVTGRILPASNVTLLATARLGDRSLQCVYKPVAGERPLWDFPDGTLAAREVAAYVVSDFLGWDVVPLTVMRDEGPLGPGMVQLWCERDVEQQPVDVVPEGEVPRGYLHVLDATDGDDNNVSLVHEQTPALYRMAVFDVLVNNADRKGGHILPMPDGHRFGVDHGVCFHTDAKLRTVLWGWARRPLTDEAVAAVERVEVGLTRSGGAGPAGPGRLRGLLTELLSEAEIEAMVERCRALLERRRMPVPSQEWPAIPWPAF